MALEAHLSELNEKHRSLDLKIAREIASPSSDDAVLQELKREKLRLKDEITKLEARLSVAAE